VTGMVSCLLAWHVEVLDQIWVPDIVFGNLQVPERLTHSRANRFASAFWLRPNGLVWWTRKTQLKLQCAMDFADLPYDQQRCEAQFMPFRDILQLELAPLDGNLTRITSYANATRPGTVEWDIVGTETEVDSSGSGSYASISRLDAVFLLRRNP